MIPAQAGFAAPGPSGGTSAPTGTTEDDNQRQAALVVAEDRRLDQVRAVTAVAGLNWTYQAKLNDLENQLQALKAGKTASAGGATAKKTLPTDPWKQPFRLNTGNSTTLVLTQQSAPYTVADLLRLAPKTFVRQPDGAYLLTENIYLNNGAELDLSSPRGLTLRLASSVDGFVSIVSFGGVLNIAGTATAPVTITSWNPRTNAPETSVTNGRAYLRAIGGRLSMTYTTLSDLGFWSGRTGGLSLTGTNRPNKGAVIHGPGKVGQPSNNATANNTQPTTVGGQPAGATTSPSDQYTVPGVSYASGQISHSSITGDAFGFFASSANGISITDTTVEHSLVDGIVMHRFVSNAAIQRVTSRYNDGDGFVLARATEQVQITDSTADDNGRNGFTLSGQPLAKGASASGESTGNFGSNTVSHSVAHANTRYGIEMIGGLKVTITNNHVDGGDMGIVARRGVDTVTISGNSVTSARRQGISVRDGVVHATIAHNVVRSVDSSIYVRDSVADISDNTIQHGTNHGVALVGAVAGVVVRANLITGIGPSAIDTQRARGVVAVAGNNISGWFDTRSFWAKIRHYASPMTLLWMAILVLILLLAIVRPRRRRRAAAAWPAVVHPYADKAPLPAKIIGEIGRVASATYEAHATAGAHRALPTQRRTDTGLDADAASSH